MTDTEVILMLTKIKSYYQNFVLNDGVAEAWIEIFKDYECEPIMASMKKYVKASDYCPVPASIIKLYNEGKAKLDSALGHDFEELMSVLTFMCKKSDVGNEVEYYRKWVWKFPEIKQMNISNKTMAKLKKYGNEHIGEDFNFIEWLEKQDEKGE